MKHRYYLFGAVMVLLVMVAVILFDRPISVSVPNVPEASVAIKEGDVAPKTVTEYKDLLKNISVSQSGSQLTLTGEARGYWYFEASFPVLIEDANGNRTSDAAWVAHAQDDWMTEAFVPFSATFTIPSQATPTGFVVLKKDNPSGEPQNDDEVKIPITF